MNNKYLGIKEIELGGKTVKLCFNWSAISTIKSELGDDGLLNLLNKNLNDVALVIKAGLEKYHPDQYSIDDIVNLSPPIIPTISAINQALEFSYWGPNGQPNSGNETDDESKKKTLFKRLSDLLLAPVYLLKNFGK